MRYLKTTEAAALLEVGPSTLRAWERRFEFPKPQRSLGGHRYYMHGEVAALQEALGEGLSISAAVVRARAGLAADADSLVRALLAYDRGRADRAIETALALRSVEGSVEEVLLPSLDAIVSRHGGDSAAWAFSARWADEWLRRAARLAPPPRPQLDPDGPGIRALELFCLRAGIRVLSLPARVLTGIGDAALVHRPDLVVLAGAEVDDAGVARWAHVIGRSVGPLPFAFYRPRSNRVAGNVLPPAPAEAQLRLRELADRAGPAAVFGLARAG
jgi:MerR family transcriptional regulator, light-induced transcriptional regulator